MTSIVRIYFSYNGIKLFKNEPHKKFISGRWQVIKDLGYPAGSPDLIGWNIKTGQVYGVEIKTINDSLKKVQYNFLDLMIKDNCIVYIGREMENGNIKLSMWNDNEQTEIEIDITKYTTSYQ